MAIEYEWRGAFDDREVSALHAAGFEHELTVDDWRGQVERHSLGWVCAGRDGELVGFVNVPWDGETHAFIMDTLVTESCRRRASAAGWSRSPSARRARRAASGCTSTSRTTCARSTSTRAVSRRPTPG